jgi:hypothetical protein
MRVAAVEHLEAPRNARCLLHGGRNFLDGPIPQKAQIKGDHQGAGPFAIFHTQHGRFQRIMDRGGPEIIPIPDHDTANFRRDVANAIPRTPCVFVFHVQQPLSLQLQPYFYDVYCRLLESKPLVNARFQKNSARFTMPENPPCLQLVFAAYPWHNAA